MKNIYLEIVGRIPPKKNLVKIGRAGNIYHDRSVNEFVNSSYIQIKKQLGNFKPIKEPVALDVVLFMDERGDADNAYCALQDCLEECGVIENDKLIRRFNVRPEKCKPSESKTFVNLVELKELENGK